VCSLLLAAADSLRQTIRRFASELAESDKTTNHQSGQTAKDQMDVQQQPLPRQQQQQHQQQSALVTVDCEEDFVAAANSEIGHLCGQIVLLWRQLLERFAGCEPIRVLLAQQHHTYRVKRFAEAFYVVNHPRQSMAKCNDADVQTYLYVSEALRKSRFVSSAFVL
jgi:hypothetical protein